MHLTQGKQLKLKCLRLIFRQDGLGNSKAYFRGMIKKDLGWGLFFGGWVRKMMSLIGDQRFVLYNFIVGSIRESFNIRIL
jgi:hypothetical protein